MPRDEGLPSAGGNAPSVSIQGQRGWSAGRNPLSVPRDDEIGLLEEKGSGGGVKWKVVGGCSPRPLEEMAGKTI